MKTNAIATTLLALLLTASPLAAQEVAIGSLYATSGTSYSTDQPVTLINLSAPATATGVVNTVTLTWRLNNGVTCPAAFKIRFFHRSDVANVFTAYATRGPFNTKEGQFTLTLSPPVTVTAGDVIGIVQTGGILCGGVVTARGGNTLQNAFVRADAEVFDLRSSTLLSNAVNVRASTTGRVYEGTIAAAGSLAGANGSYFRTSVHLTNPNNATPISCELVFHPAGLAPSAADRRIAFTIPPKGVQFYEDIVGAMGLSGLGSIDLYTVGSFPPFVNVRVFNDQGPAGTSGFTQDFIPPSKTLYRGWSYLAVSGGPNFRTNIGMRGMGGPSKLQFSLHSREGALLGTVERELPADVFEQVPLSALFGTANPVAGYITVVFVSGSPAIIYASTTDNRTNDSSIQFARTLAD